METGFNNILGQQGHATTAQMKSTNGITIEDGARQRGDCEADGRHGGKADEGNRVPQKLHRDFSNLVAAEAMVDWGYGNWFAANTLRFGQRAKLAPAFFIADETTTSAVAGAPDTAVESLKLPFEAFWICSWQTDGAGVKNIFHYFERTHAVMFVRRYLNSGGRNAWSGNAFMLDSNLSCVVNDPTFNQSLLWEALELIDLVNSPCERIDDPPQSVLVRQQLAIGGRDWKQTRFITVRPNRSARHVRGRNGSSRSPHNRRGHWRHYRNGKRVWIADCAIHGGSKGVRNYVV
ncbi:MAG: hypothetical protein ACKOQ8_06655 [Micrococcales bacterium]